MSRPATNPARLVWLSTWPHGHVAPPGTCDQRHVGPFQQVAGRDGKIYRRCAACGVTIGAW